jgi:hypothetical protein
MTNNFKLQRSEIEEYKEILNDDYIMFEMDFIKRTAYSRINAPAVKGMAYPLFGTPQAYFKAKIKEKYTRGVLFYQKEYEFLKNPEKWIIIKADTSIIPPAILYFWEGRFFVERKYCKTNMSNSIKKPRFNEDFNKLLNLSNSQYKKLYFERIIGFFIDFNDWQFPFYHTSTAHMTFDALTQETASSIKKYFQQNLPQALREINNKNIHYKECQPTNIGYQFNRDKFTFNPHDCISFDPLNVETSDLGALVYTHDWLRTEVDIEKICKYYLGPNSSRISRTRVKNKILQDLLWLEKGDATSMSGWQRRNISFAEK